MLLTASSDQDQATIASNHIQDKVLHKLCLDELRHFPCHFHQLRQRGDTPPSDGSYTDSSPGDWYQQQSCSSHHRDHISSLLQPLPVIILEPVSQRFLEAPLKLIATVLQLLTTDIDRNLELLHSRRTDTHWQTKKHGGSCYRNLWDTLFKFTKLFYVITRGHSNI